MPSKDWTGVSDGGRLRDIGGNSKGNNGDSIPWTGKTENSTIKPPGPAPTNIKDSGRTSPGTGRY